MPKSRTKKKALDLRLSFFCLFLFDFIHIPIWNKDNNNFMHFYAWDVVHHKEWTEWHLPFFENDITADLKQREWWIVIQHITAYHGFEFGQVCTTNASRQLLYTFLIFKCIRVENQIHSLMEEINCLCRNYFIVNIFAPSTRFETRNMHSAKYIRVLQVRTRRIYWNELPLLLLLFLFFMFLNRRTNLVVFTRN